MLAQSGVVLTVFLLTAARPVLGQITLVADIAPGDASSYVSGLTVYDGTLYFAANADGDTPALWRYAGDGAPELAASLPSIAHPVPYADRLYLTMSFLGEPGEPILNQIWEFDPATSDIRSITGLSTDYSDLTVYDGRLFFTTFSDDSRVLLAYDADTDAVELAASGPLFHSGIGDPTVYDGKLFFRAQPELNSDDFELWFYDSVADEVTQAAEINPSGSSSPSGMIVYDNRLFFAARDGGSNEELWTYDASTGEANNVVDLAPGDLPSTPRNFTLYDGRLFFSVIGDNYDGDIWAYDADTDETELIVDAAYPTELEVFADDLYFGSASVLGRYDAATSSTLRLPLPETSISYPVSLTAFGDRLYFTMVSTEWGQELWAYSPLAVASEPGSPHRTTSLSLFPNPASISVSLSLSMPEAQPLTIKVYDLLGRTVATLYEGSVPAHSDRPLQLNVSNIPAGTYFVRAEGHSFSASQRLTMVR